MTMVLFKKGEKKGAQVVVKEGVQQVLHINYEGSSEVPSIEDSTICLAQTIEKLAQMPDVARIVFHQRKKYEYGFKQTSILVEISKIYNHFIKQKKILSQAAVGEFGEGAEGSYRLRNLQYLILNLLKTDPVGAFVETKRMLREEKIAGDENSRYFELLTELYSLLANTKLVALAKDSVSGYKIGDRDVYRAIFKPAVTPDFMYTRLMATPPLDAEEIDAYSIGKNCDVQVFNLKDNVKQLYHVVPPEFRIDEDKYDLLETARKVLAEHQPKAEEYTDIERMRQTFFNIGRDLLMELADHKGLKLDYNELDELAHILVRYTIGFGFIETLLQDDKVQDIAINSPPGETPIFLVHGDYDECVTNIIPAREDVESWASKLRLISGRPLDEANPVLDTELIIPGARARVAVISQPLNPYGLGFSIRRHRDKPWTLPLFIKSGMISDLAAGTLSFLIDGAASLLVAGTRGSGKTSLLGSVLVEVMRKYRIITVEDTLELPTEALRDFGYNIQPMKVRSALAHSGSEVSADEGIRTSLRMGDSALIVGEVRSVEALALFEAMRTGALANTVAGTIHGDSPYGVFDRIVNDLKVPRTSFKAVDIIIVANPVKSADGLHRRRRIMSITEVRKTWEEDPLREGGFVDLFRYDAQKDTLVPTDDLINGNSEIIKRTGGQIKEWAGSWDAIWDNILLRAKIKQTILDYSNKLSINDLLEAKTIIQMNDSFHRISDNVRQETGFLDSKRIFFEWEEEFKRYIKQNYGML